MHVTVEEAIETLNKGGVVAIPTETVYGLAADATNASALQKIYETKQRPSNNPLIIHIANQQAVEQWAKEFPPLAQTLAKAFWPGAFTLVLSAAGHVLPIVTANQPTVALRVPNHPIALSLLEKSGLGLAAPSANRYTQVSPTRSEHVLSGLGVHVPVIDGGPCDVGIESTIVSVIKDEKGVWQWQMLRQGMIDAKTVEAVAGQPPSHQSRQVVVPGQHRLHYAPKTALQVFDSMQMLEECTLVLLGESKKVVIMHINPIKPMLGAQLEKMANTPEGYAKQLYETLHRVDQLGVDAIVVESPPSTQAWSAIHDRLHRANNQSLR